MQRSKSFDIPPNWKNSLWMQKEFVISLLGIQNKIFIFTNSECRQQIHYHDEFVHMKSVSVCKISNLLIQICEGFEHVSSQMTCTVDML